MVAVTEPSGTIPEMAWLALVAERLPSHTMTTSPASAVEMVGEEIPAAGANDNLPDVAAGALPDGTSTTVTPNVSMLTPGLSTRVSGRVTVAPGAPVTLPARSSPWLF